WYYLKESGEMATGWFKDTNGKWYYLKESGEMTTGWFKDTNNKWYYFYSNGEMAVNTVIDGYIINSDGSLR
ncbi:MAG: hypothetical protein ACI398_09430, partial [Clostridium sp.]